MDKPIEEQINQLATQSKVQLIVSQEATAEDEISLGELFGIIFNGKKMISLITLIAFTLGALFAGINAFVLQDEVGKVDTVVSFQFVGIEEGLNPEGEPFNVHEMTSKGVLEQTVSKLGLKAQGIDSEMLRENIEIQGIVPADVQNQMNLINQMAEKDVTQLEKLQQITYYPNQYKITLHVTKDMGIRGEDAEQILSSLISNYKDYFMTTYSDKELLSTAITTIDASRYDYSEYLLMVDNVLKDMETFLEESSKEAPEYRGKSTGLSFDELGQQVGMVRNIELNNTQAIINTFMLTKNKDRLIALYQNSIKKLAIELEEKQSLAQSIRQAAADYQKDKLVVMGQEAGKGNVEVPTSSKVYDELIAQALVAEQEATKIQYNMAYYQDLLAKLTASEAAENAARVDTAPYIQQVEESIVYIQEQVTRLLDDVNNTIEEYYNTEAFKNSVKRDMPPMYQSFTMDNIKGSVLTVVIATLLGGVVSVLYVLVQGMMTDDKKKKVQGGHHEA
ncbi:MAG: hypothetical protein ACRDDX_09475 [Cellulosilyticaceae bacterium]